MEGSHLQELGMEGSHLQKLGIEGESPTGVGDGGGAFFRKLVKQNEE
jgi:hypothetical protein